MFIIALYGSENSIFILFSVLIFYSNLQTYILKVNFSEERKHCTSEPIIHFLFFFYHDLFMEIHF